jgi:hypothetical protein
LELNLQTFKLAQSYTLSIWAPNFLNFSSIFS